MKFQIKKLAAAVIAVILLAALGIGPQAKAESYSSGTYPAAFAFKNIATNATTTVKSGGGVLTAIVINTKGASSNTITIYDNTAGSGTKIGIIDSTVSGQIRLDYNVKFGTGLTIVTATGTAPDITVCYR